MRHQNRPQCRRSRSRTARERIPRAGGGADDDPARPEPSEPSLDPAGAVGARRGKGAGKGKGGREQRGAAGADAAAARRRGRREAAERRRERQEDAEEEEEEEEEAEEALEARGSRARGAGRGDARASRGRRRRRRRRWQRDGDVGAARVRGCHRRRVRFPLHGAIFTCASCVRVAGPPRDAALRAGRARACRVAVPQGRKHLFNNLGVILYQEVSPLPRARRVRLVRGEGRDVSS